MPDLFGTPPSSSTTYSQPSSPSGDSILEFPVQVGQMFRDTGSYPAQPDSGRESLTTTTGSNGAEEPTTLYHRNLPIFAVESQTVGSEHALQASFNCPTEFLSHAPPTMVTENYCFVVDGDAVDAEALNADVEWWKPTSRPTHYYYSSDFKTFRRVHIVIVRGRIVGARIRGVVRKQQQQQLQQQLLAVQDEPAVSEQPSQAPSSSKSPQPPVAVHKNVPLSNVFQVCRYYSYWKTCAHFHRIVTVITPVKELAQNIFKKRVFVQFLWHRDAKESEKLRVAMEYQPNKAHLLQPTGGGGSFSAAAGTSASGTGPAQHSSGSGASNPPSGSTSPKSVSHERPRADTTSSTGSGDASRRQTLASIQRRRLSSVFKRE